METPVKLEKNVGKNQKTQPQAKDFFDITLCVGLKSESVAFFSLFSRFFLSFFSRFSHVCAHKLYQSAIPTHSVIWALVNYLMI